MGSLDRDYFYRPRKAMGMSEPPSDDSQTESSGSANPTTSVPTAEHTGSTSDELVEIIHARGHEYVSATHTSTFEITTDEYLTPAGDCILAIEADKAPSSFDTDFVSACRDENATITLTVESDGHEHTVVGRGDPTLALTNDRSAVGRTSSYVDDRTILVEADCSANGFDRTLIESLQRGCPVTVTIRVS